MRVVSVPKLADFTVGTIVNCIEVSCFLCSEGVKVNALEKEG
jgi:hypothetical protein